MIKGAYLECSNDDLHLYYIGCLS